MGSKYLNQRDYGSALKCIAAAEVDGKTVIEVGRELCAVLGSDMGRAQWRDWATNSPILSREDPALAWSEIEKDVRQFGAEPIIERLARERGWLPLSEQDRSGVVGVMTEEARRGVYRQARADEGTGATITDSGAFDHASMGDRLIEEFNVGTVDGIPVIWDADAMRYRAGREAIEKKMVELRRGIRRNQRAEVIAYLDLQAPERTMADPRFIAFENGILDISTMGLSEPSQDTVIVNVIPHRWNPSAVCPELDAAISAWACGDAARATNIRETIGLCMYRDRHMAQSPVLIGRGANGKSTFLNFLREVIGRENVSGLNLSAIGKRFQSIALMGRIANICDDLSNAFVAGELMEDAKKALSGDEVGGEYKGGRTFFFRPYCQFVFSCNSMPRLGDTSFGSFRRFVPVKFEAVFSAKDGTANINQEKILSTEAAYERAIVLGIEALRGCIKRGCMTPTEEAAEAIEDMRRQNSSVVSWVADTMWSAEELIGMQTANAYAAYVDYCNAAGMRCVNRNTFTAEIIATYGIDTARPRSHGQKSTFVRRG